MEARLQQVVDSGLEFLGAFEDADGFANGKRLLVYRHFRLLQLGELNLQGLNGSVDRLITFIRAVDDAMRCRKTSSPASQPMTRKRTTTTAERMIPSGITAAPGIAFSPIHEVPERDQYRSPIPQGIDLAVLPVSGRDLR